MSYLLRKFSLTKWEINRNLPPEEYTADAITGCTRTQNNTLSVWGSDSCDFTSESFKDLTVALAITMPQPSTMDLIWLEEDWLREKNIDLVNNLGDSGYISINELHKDIANLNHLKLSIVGTHIVQRLSDEKNYKRIKRKEVIGLVTEKLNQPDTFSIEDLSDQWQKALEK
jgi:hypothetical protein